MPQLTDHVIALVNAQWHEERTPEKLEARWKVSDNGRSISRQKEVKRPERTIQRDGTWFLQLSKLEGGRWVAEDRVIIPLQSSKMITQHIPISYRLDTDPDSGREGLRGVAPSKSHQHSRRFQSGFWKHV